MQSELQVLREKIEAQEERIAQLEKVVFILLGVTSDSSRETHLDAASNLSSCLRRVSFNDVPGAEINSPGHTVESASSSTPYETLSSLPVNAPIIDEYTRGNSASSYDGMGFHRETTRVPTDLNYKGLPVDTPIAATPTPIDNVAAYDDLVNPMIPSHAPPEASLAYDAIPGTSSTMSPVTTVLRDNVITERSAATAATAYETFPDSINDVPGAEIMTANHVLSTVSRAASSTPIFQLNAPIDEYTRGNSASSYDGMGFHRETTRVPTDLNYKGLPVDTPIAATPTPIDNVAAYDDLVNPMIPSHAPPEASLAYDAIPGTSSTMSPVTTVLRDNVITESSAATAATAYETFPDSINARNTPVVHPSNHLTAAPLFTVMEFDQRATNDWNAAFQMACDYPSAGSFKSRLEWSLALRRVSSAFATAAKGIIVALVDDSRRPLNKRRFKPVNAGGIAGKEAGAGLFCLRLLDLWSGFIVCFTASCRSCVQEVKSSSSTAYFLSSLVTGLGFTAETLTPRKPHR